MRAHFALAGFAVLAAGLVACGGGGGSVTPGTISPVAQATPLNQFYGLNLPANAAFTLAGTSTVDTVYNYPKNAAFPTPYPSTHVTTGVQEVGSLGTVANPFGRSGQSTPIHIVETDTQPLLTTILTSDTFYSLSATGFFEVGSSQKDNSGNTFVYNYSKIPYQLDALPETAGASWTNSGTSVFAETDTDGTQSNRIYDATGTYSETTTQPSLGATLTITENGDGSGTYIGPFSGGYYNVIKFAPPSAGSITVGLYQTLTAATPKRTYKAADWFTAPFAANGLYKETDSVAAAASFPAACNVPATFGTSGNQIVQTINRVDAVLGYTEAETITTYTSATAGPVCSRLNDVQTTYYDWNDDYTDGTNYHYHFVGTPLTVVTTNETLALSASSVLSTTRKPASASIAQTLALPPVTLARASFEHKLDLQRRERLRGFMRTMNAMLKGDAR